MEFINKVRKTLLLLSIIVCACHAPDNMRTDLNLKWIPQDSKTSVSLRGICAVSEDVAWASGAKGVCLVTEDGGTNWRNISPVGYEAIDFRDVFAFDRKTAVIAGAGEPAKILRTTDGGASWKEVFSDSKMGVFLDAVAFSGEQNGVAFSDPVEGGFFLLLSDDGGGTWEQIPFEKIPLPVEGEAGFAASGTCAAMIDENIIVFATGGSAARVFRSDDRGETWAVADTPLACGAPSKGVFSVVFINKMEGVVVGGDWEKPEELDKNAAWTEDGGKTWALVQSNRPSGYRSSVAHAKDPNGSVLIAVGPSGSDYSIDHGRSWRPFGAKGFHSISFAGFHGWASGSDGRIARISF